MLGDFFCHVLRLFCQIDYFQSLFTSILIRLCHSSPRMCNIANRVSGILNKVLITFGNRRLEVVFFKTLGINNGIKNRFIKDIKRKIRNHQMVLNKRILAFQLKHTACAQSVKSALTPADKVRNAFSYQFFYCFDYLGFLHAVTFIVTDKGRGCFFFQ